MFMKGLLGVGISVKGLSKGGGIGISMFMKSSLKLEDIRL